MATPNEINKTSILPMGLTPKESPMQTKDQATQDEMVIQQSMESKQIPPINPVDMISQGLVLQKERSRQNTQLVSKTSNEGASEKITERIPSLNQELKDTKTTARQHENVFPAQDSQRLMISNRSNIESSSARGRQIQQTKSNSMPVQVLSNEYYLEAKREKSINLQNKSKATKKELTNLADIQKQIMKLQSQEVSRKETQRSNKNDERTLSGKGLSARSRQITQFPLQPVLSSRKLGQELAAKDHLCHLLQNNEFLRPQHGDRKIVKTQIQLENHHVKQQKNVQQDQLMSSHRGASSQLSPDQSHILISGDTRNTDEMRGSINYGHKSEVIAQSAQRLTSDRVSEDVFQRDNSVLKQERHMDVSSSIFKENKNSITSIPSSKLFSLQNDRAVAISKTGMMSRGSSHEFENVLQHDKPSPITNVYKNQQARQNNQYKNIQTQKNTRRQIDSKEYPCSNLQLKKPFKPIHIQSRQKSNQFKSHLQQQLLNHHSITHPQAKTEQTSIGPTEPQQKDLEFTVRYFERAGAEDPAAAGDQAPVRLPELGDRGGRLLHGSSAMSMVQTKKNQPTSNNSTLPSRKSHFRQSQVVNTFDDQYQSKLFFQPTHHNHSLAPKTLKVNQRAQDNLLSGKSNRNGATSQGTRNSADKKEWTLAVATAVASQDIIHLDEPSEVPTPIRLNASIAPKVDFKSINQSSMESLNQRCSQGPYPESDERLISKSSAELLYPEGPQTPNLLEASGKIPDITKSKRLFSNVQASSTHNNIELVRQMNNTSKFGVSRASQHGSSTKYNMPQYELEKMKQVKRGVTKLMTDPVANADVLSESQSSLKGKSQIGNTGDRPQQLNGLNINEQGSSEIIAQGPRKYNPIFVYNQKLPLMEKRSRAQPAFQSKAQNFNPQRAGSRVKDHPGVRGQNASPLFKAHHVHNGNRNDQVSRQKSLEDINEKLDRKKQTEEWLREYSLDKREQNKAWYLQNNKGKVMDKIKNNNKTISIQIQDEPSKVNEEGQADQNQGKEKPGQHLPQSQAGLVELKGRSNQLPSKSPKPFTQSKFLTKHEMQRANDAKVLQPYQRKTKRVPVPGNQLYSGGYQSPPVIVGGTPDPDPYKSHGHESKAQDSSASKGGEVPQSPKLAALSTQWVKRRGSGAIEQKEAQAHKGKVNTHPSVAAASENVVSDNTAQEWLTQSSIAKIEKSSAPEENQATSPTKRNQPISRSQVPTHHGSKHARTKVQADKKGEGSNIRQNKRNAETTLVTQKDLGNVVVHAVPAQRGFTEMAEKKSNKTVRKIDQFLQNNQHGSSSSLEQITKRRFGRSPTKENGGDTNRKQTLQGQSSLTSVTQKKVHSEEPVKIGKSFSLEEFDVLKTLGKGSFGQVKLIRHQKTHMLFALKILQKEMIRGSKHIQHIQNERNILRRLSKDGGVESKGSRLFTPSAGAFFVGFYESMQDDLNLYLLLEYLPGGELLKQIKQHLSLSMNDSRFYLAEVLTALHQLHQKNIIYRDLKPENILLDREGHIKLIDFGFSKQLKNLAKDRTTTNCGTPAYAAPEVIMGTGYGYKADIWSFGILICEMIGGFTPFSQKGLSGMDMAQDSPTSPGGKMATPNQMVDLANSGRLNLPKNMDTVTRDVVKKILVPDPNMRIEIKAIMQHKFFAGIDWDQVANKRDVPPYCPRVDDARYQPEEELKVIERESDSDGIVNQKQSIEGKQLFEIVESTSQKELGDNPSVPTAPSSSKTNNQMEMRAFKQKFGNSKSNSNGYNVKIGSQTSSKSSPYIKRTTPSKILGDYHLTKINKVFEDF